MRFRTDDDPPAFFQIHVFSLAKENPVSFIEKIHHRNTMEFDYQLNAQNKTTMKKYPSWIREFHFFTQGDARLKQKVRDIYVKKDDFLYLLHFQALENEYLMYYHSYLSMVQSFSPIVKTVVKNKISQNTSLTGKWSAVPDSQMAVVTFFENGLYDMEQIKGTFEVSGTLLTLKNGSQPATVYYFSLDGDKLELSGGGLKETLIFYRIHAKKNNL